MRSWTSSHDDKICHWIRQLDYAIIQKKQREAYEIETRWDDICPPVISATFATWAKSIGAPMEFLYFPFITMASAMMHIDSRMDISPSWSEPPIIWNIVAARKGEKKSAALRLLLKALESVQEVEKRAEVLQAALIDAENKAAAEEKEVIQQIHFSKCFIFFC